MFKILQAKLQPYMYREIQMYKLGLEKTEEPEIKLPHPLYHKKARELQEKTSTSPPLIMLKPWTMWIRTNCGKFLKRRKYQTTWPAFWETCRQDKKQWIEVDMEQKTGSKLEKEHIKAVYCHSVYYLTWRIHHVKCHSGWIISWNQDFQEK